MKILAGLTQKNLAKCLAKELNCQYVESYTTTFDDSELRVQVLEDLNGCEVTIVQSTSRPVNNNLMELLLLVDTVKRAGVKRITAVIPYFGYSRQDRRSYVFAPVSARLVANLLEAAGVQRIITIDLHSQQLEGFFKIEVQNLNPSSLFFPLINIYDNIIIVSPDIGGITRARAMSNLCNVDIAIINKNRTVNNEYQISDIIGNVATKHCILIDDIVDSGQTICKGTKLLMERGALSVNAFITHPVLSSTSQEEIDNSHITSLYITDTIAVSNLSSKLQIVSILPLLVAALKK